MSTPQQTQNFPGIFIVKKKKKCKSSDPEKESQSSGSSHILDESISEEENYRRVSLSSPTWTGSDFTDEVASTDLSPTAHSPVESTRLFTDEDPTAQTRPKRPKKKKKKADEPTPENPAVDAIRYKTKMCRNWEQFEKCPYGPRCLFAHGKRELRSYSMNHTAISTAARSGSPDKNFYSVGHFPSFIPVPWEVMAEQTQPLPEALQQQLQQPAPQQAQPVSYMASVPQPQQPHEYLPQQCQQCPGQQMAFPPDSYSNFQFPSNMFFSDPNMTVGMNMGVPSSVQPSLSCSILA